MVPPNVTHHAVLEEVGKIPAEYLPFLLEMIRAFKESLTLKPAARASSEAGRRRYVVRHGPC